MKVQDQKWQIEVKLILHHFGGNINWFGLQKKKLQKEGSWFKESTCKLRSKAKFNSRIQFDSNESKLVPRNLNHGPCLIEPKSNYLHFAIIKKKLKLQIGRRLLITNLLGFAFYNQSFPFLYISIHCRWHSHHKSPCVKKITWAILAYFLTTFGEIFLEIFWNIFEFFFEKILIWNKIFHNILLIFMLKFWQKMSLSKKLKSIYKFFYYLKTIIIMFNECFC